jgi:hypothetical protein
MFDYVGITLYSRLIKGREVDVFLGHCSNYFMEVVSTLCFGRQSVPEPNLIRTLMARMFLEQRSGKLDTVPIVTSSLLQLLLENRCGILHYS